MYLPRVWQQVRRWACGVLWYKDGDILIAASHGGGSGPWRPGWAAFFHEAHAMEADGSLYGALELGGLALSAVLLGCTLHVPIKLCNRRLKG